MRISDWSSDVCSSDLSTSSSRRRTMTEPAEASARKGALAGLGTLGIIVTGLLTAVGLKAGGYVDHPNDPGGATNHGVTEEVARADGFTPPMKHFPKEWDSAIFFKGHIKEPGIRPIIEN